MMRKSMFAALLVLIMLLGGCSDVSTAPTRNDESELVTETEAAAEAESTKSIYSSESNESKAPETGAALDAAKPAHHAGDFTQRGAYRDVLRLRTEQLRPSFWYFEQKTGKRRRMRLPVPLLEAIQRQAGEEWAFPGRAGKRPKTRQAVWADVKRAQRAFRLPQNIGTHSARKVYAVKLLEKYGDIERVRRALNHSSTAVTSIYAMADLLLERKQGTSRRREA